MFVADTNKGNIRDNNEDSYYIPGNIENLFIIADGMGGHLAGETASKMAIESICNYFLENEEYLSEDLEKIMINSVISANYNIFKMAQKDPKYKGMGTTLSMAYLYNEYMYYINIGDSRIYEIFDSSINQITVDDSFVNILIELGEITQEEAKNHPKKNVIMKALGISEKIDVTIGKIKLKNNAKYLLCSDGLTNMLDDIKILKIVNKNKIEKAKSKLVKEALSNGGTDNITLIIIDNK